MKDGTTHLAYKPEHAVDLDTGAVIAAELYPADQGDTTTLPTTLTSAEAKLAAVGAAPTADEPAELVTDKGYFGREVLKSLADGAWTTRIAEPKGKGLSRWHGDDAARRAVYNNRNRLLSGVAKAAFKLRAEVVERGFAQVLDRGGMRRTWLRGRENVGKRYLIHVAGHNLGVLLRQLIGAGTPREAAAKGLAVLLLVLRQEQSLIIILALNNPPAPGLAAAIVITPDASSTQSSSTGCYAVERCATKAPRQPRWSATDVNARPSLRSRNST